MQRQEGRFLHHYHHHICALDCTHYESFPTFNWMFHQPSSPSISGCSLGEDTWEWSCQQPMSFPLAKEWHLLDFLICQQQIFQKTSGIYKPPVVDQPSRFFTIVKGNQGISSINLSLRKEAPEVPAQHRSLSSFPDQTLHQVYGLFHALGLVYSSLTLW